MKQNKISIKLLSPNELLAIKEQVWAVCTQIYEMTEQDYYDRLSIFSHFAIFLDGDKIVGFLSFFLAKTEIEGKNITVLGVGHGGILQAYRDQAAVPRATMKFFRKVLLQNPFQQIYIWGMAMSHLSYRMGMRGARYHYPNNSSTIPSFYKKLLDWVGQRYFAATYDPEHFTAAVKFSIKDSKVIPSEAELADPVVANFVKMVPSSLQPGNRTGLIYVFPTGSNYWFWFKKFILGIKTTAPAKA